jgi:hypothetical protein
MGLDMYLQRKERLTAKEYNDDNSHLYWRKANSIHFYFISNGNFLENAEDSKEEYGPYEITREQLYKLVEFCSDILDTEEVHQEELSYIDIGKRDVIKEVVNYPLNRELAERLLPSHSGFFFGETSYGYHYYLDLTQTVKKLLRELEMYPDQQVWYYWASW